MLPRKPDVERSMGYSTKYIYIYIYIYTSCHSFLLAITLPQPELATLWIAVPLPEANFRIAALFCRV